MLDEHPDNDDRASILLVDDTPVDLRLLAAILAARGYRVRAVSSGAGALDAVQAQRPDIILLDIMMPEMDGFQLCAHLKAQEQTRDTPILFISGLNAVEDKVRAFRAGGVDYIGKPFRAEEVLARVQTHLALRELRRRLEIANQDSEARNVELQTRNAQLQEALHTIKTLSGITPICAWCGKRIKDDAGNWVSVETYLRSHSQATFTHGMCPICLEGAGDDIETMDL